ncbi:hypothetical protein [Sulfurospirillum oryzae]|uniref:hypothetical protein n=1 Tax=Sulfurospirillum oryzae TaxID=2976535 RepID=UPI0021E73FF8|nr:hypothetical protein [Sulfurospirillum oryzae]
MIHLERVAREIKTIGLYDLVYQDVEKALGKKHIELIDIENCLQTHPEILEAYKQTNLEYNISNIHIKAIDEASVTLTCKDDVKRVNANLAKLRQIEKYTIDFEQSSILVIIMSIEFFVLFSVQYFIVLLNLKEWQWEIYGVFGLSVLWAWLYAKKERKKFECHARHYAQLYEETLQLLDELETHGCIHKKSLMIEESSEDHI